MYLVKCNEMHIVFFVYLCSCGVYLSQGAPPEIMDRILHGRDSDIKYHPYQVALVTTNGKHRKILCGGALIKPKIVFTAAHCTHVDENTVRPNLTVLIGANSLFDPKGTSHEIHKVLKHPEFKFDMFDNDFSAVILKKPAVYSDRVQPIKISEEDHPGGIKGVVSGWGLTERGRPSVSLKSVKLVLEDWDKCQDHFPRPVHPKITKNHICIKPSEKTTTYGDSGSPLVVDGKLVGLVSFGRMVDSKRKATVFTRVKSYSDFVRDGVDKYF
ncbi:kallikrein-6-like [Coccinella septempunctata]|uniref:kallikrein-6-like n=1 Tax=Coccinella septempunctata TaxID=41139 RepID=UPI001D093DA3|nr:kallikrein-6-like [Coccinella septempunctata]